jgi:hypothetical protein
MVSKRGNGGREKSGRREKGSKRFRLAVCLGSAKKT